jgi:hypothetical protein
VLKNLLDHYAPRLETRDSNVDRWLASDRYCAPDQVASDEAQVATFYIGEDGIVPSANPDQSAGRKGRWPCPKDYSR